jgi:indole-3-glycerol phosphate synthase
MAETAVTLLDQIIAARRERLAETQALVPLEVVQRRAEARSERRDLAAAISGVKLRVIAELKRASPRRGLLRRHYRRRELAQGYESAGASALSVLTEEQFFLGSLEDLTQAREAVELPVLRKDFILDDYQVYESVAAGADALLLIVAVLSDRDLRRLIELCQLLQIAALVEVHTEQELERALAAGATMVGVNNRDLKTMQVDLETSFWLLRKIPSTCITVSESGIKTADELIRLAQAGFNAALIGERLLEREDPGKELAGMLGGARELVRPSA